MKRILLIVLGLLPIYFLQAQIVINEGSNKNYSTLADEDGDFNDWIELYNAGATPIDLFNYSLTDDSLVPAKWVMPHLILPAGGYAVIFCSQKDRYASTPFTTVINTGSFSPVVGWNNHNFTTPFTWDGVSNIVINVCSYSNTGYITNSVHNQTSTAYNSTLYSFQDGSPASCSHITGTTATQRPNIQLNGQTIGTGTIQNSPYDYPAPYGNWYWGARHQMMVTASELFSAGIVAGNLTSLAFDIASTDVVTYSYIELSINAVSDNAMTNTFYPLGGFRNHTNFTISGGGEVVYLYTPAQVMESRLDVNCGPDYDVSIGSFPNGWAIIKKFMPPTPNASNNGSIPLTGIALAPVFSVNSGSFSTPFSLNIVDPNVPVAQIYYTTDGSEPTTASNLWSGTSIPVFMTTVVRARAFYAGMLPSPVTSASYFFNLNHITPIISVLTDNSNLYGPTGMFDNYWNDWLKPAHVEYFDSTSSHNLVFTQPVGIIMDGGYGGSRSNPQHSFRIELANGILGAGSINYPVIPDRPLRTKYSNFYLRNGSNQWLNFPYKDASQVKMMATGTYNYYSAWRPVSVYINGQYFGLYELREKYDAEMFKTLEGADKDSTEIMSLSAFYNYTLRALNGGSVQSFYDSRDAFNLILPSDTGFWNQADQYFDMTYYNDYIIAESWMGNTDWPQNNIKIYRSNKTDFRWRFCVIDQELAMNPNGWTDCNFDHIDYLQNQDPNNPFINIWLRGIQNGRFKNYFINRFADQMNTVYLPARLLNIENGFFNQTVSEMENEYFRWGNPWDIPTQINDFYNRHLTFQDELTCRTPQVRNHIQNNFGLPQQVDVTLDVYPIGAGKIHISTITPEPYPWNGVYFDGIPVKIEAIANPGYVFSHWGDNGLIADTMNIVYNDTLETNATQFKAYFASTLSIENESANDFQLFPSPTEQILNVINKKMLNGSACSYEILDLNGRAVMNGMLNTNSMQTVLQVGGLPSGIYFIRFKTSTTQMVSLKFVKL